MNSSDGRVCQWVICVSHAGRRLRLHAREICERQQVVKITLSIQVAVCQMQFSKNGMSFVVL